ncbi:MAG: hypothetical protein ACXU82_07345 [Caulobacteraceae bacterium]
MDRSYRFYSLSDRNEIMGAANREFPNDQEALDHAATLLFAFAAVEVWQTDRLVGSLLRPPDGRPPGIE